MADFFNTTGGMALIMVAQVLAMVAFVMISLLFLVYGDRKVWAAVQMRRGPNVVGVFGLLQTVADALKYVVKEVVIPAGADRAVFMLAPLTSFVLALIAWAAQRLDSPVVLEGPSGPTARSAELLKEKGVTASLALTTRRNGAVQARWANTAN